MPALLRSLRFRIALAFVVWTALVQSIMMLMLPAVREAYALNAMDLRMEAPSVVLAEKVRGGSPTSADLTGWTLEPRFQGWGERLFLQLRSADGAVLASSENLGGHALPFDRQAADRGAGSAAHATAPASAMPDLRETDPVLSGRARARVLTVAVPGAAGEPTRYLQVARSLAAWPRSTASETCST
jgi:hypothetical protein